jgi:hypothetical protein
MAERKIGNLTYRVSPLPAYQAYKLGRRIANLAGPALPALAGALSQKEETARDGAALAALGALSIHLDEKADDLVRELAEMAEVNWQGVWTKVNVDQDELVQDVGTMMLVVFFSLESNLKSFTSGPLAKVLGAATTASQKAS